MNSYDWPTLFRVLLKPAPFKNREFRLGAHSINFTKMKMMTLLVWALLETTVWAKEPSERSIHIFTTPLSVLLAQMPIGAGVKVSDEWVIGAKVIPVISRTVLSAGVEGHWWFGKKAFEPGWVLSPFCSYVPEYQTPITGLMFYRHWTKSDGLTIGLGAGLSHIVGASKSLQNNTWLRPWMQAVGPEIVFRMGYAL
ncbi:MAG: hypothetical protein JNL01_14890 [Bdellovibrionales bacterium]|nr:hypothetical protein [Bdellovibrionales bacterium]